jgi:hypothetical protein
MPLRTTRGRQVSWVPLVGAADQLVRGPELHVGLEHAVGAALAQLLDVGVGVAAWLPT